MMDNELRNERFNNNTRIFRHHPPKDEQEIRKFAIIRYVIERAADEIACIVPESREYNNAIDKLREAMFWAIAGIVCSDGRE